MITKQIQIFQEAFVEYYRTVSIFQEGTPSEQIFQQIGFGDGNKVLSNIRKQPPRPNALFNICSEGGTFLEIGYLFVDIKKGFLENHYS